MIRRSVKHGGNLCTSLMSLGARVLPYAIQGISKVAPAFATGAASALGDIGIKKTIWKRYYNTPNILPYDAVSCSRAYAVPNR